MLKASDMTWNLKKKVSVCWIQSNTGREMLKKNYMFLIINSLASFLSYRTFSNSNHSGWRSSAINLKLFEPSLSLTQFLPRLTFFPLFFFFSALFPLFSLRYFRLKIKRKSETLFQKPFSHVYFNHGRILLGCLGKPWCLS